MTTFLTLAIWPVFCLIAGVVIGSVLTYQKQAGRKPFGRLKEGTPMIEGVSEDLGQEVPEHKRFKV